MSHGRDTDSLLKEFFSLIISNNNLQQKKLATYDLDFSARQTWTKVVRQGVNA
jgi:hypothetical protein